jgi:hypothetical protein
MINVQSAEFFMTLIAFTLVYIVTVTVVGFFHAWVTEKMGDETAAEAGFLTLNPWPHIDPLGLLCILIFSVGWGRRIPINTTNIQARSKVGRWVKLALACWADAIMHIALATGAVIALIVIFGPHVLYVVEQMTISNAYSYMNFAVNYPEVSSIAISFAFILIECIYLNIFLAIFSFVFYGLEMLIKLLMENSPEYSQYSTMLTVLIYILIVMLLLTGILRQLLAFIIYSIGLFIASLFGAV